MKAKFYSLLTSIALVVTIFFFQSCSPVPYANVGQNVPLFKNKGEVNINASVANTDDAAGWGAQTAWAVDSSIAVIGSFYSMKESDAPQSPEEWSGKGRYFELGVGLFGNGKKDPGLVYETFAGLGFSRIENQTAAGSHLDVRYNKFFLQGSIGYSINWIEIALTPRISYINYTKHSYSFPDAENNTAAAAYFRNNDGKLVLEPGVTVRLGYENIKLNVNYCGSTFKAKEAEDINLNTEFVSIGLNYLFTNRYKK